MLILRRKPSLLLFLLSFCFSSEQFAQQKSAYRTRDRRNPAIGLHYSISSFNSPAIDFSKINNGYALSFLDGIAGKYDYMIQGGSVSAKYRIGDDNNESRNLLHYINIYGIRRFFSDTVLVNPYLAVGPGMTLYNKDVNAALNGGVGLQLRLSNNIFLQTQVAYHVNFSALINNNVSTSIGLFGIILQRKKSKAKINSDLNPALQPITDIDGDGIPNIDDACPTIPGPAAFHGCPDTDRDGISDNEDKCPLEPGSFAYGGCPEPNVSSPSPITYIDTLIVDNVPQQTPDSISAVINELAQHIYFETNKATFKATSTHVLNRIVELLKNRPFKQLLIEGHTDNTGTVNRNQQLSAERAKTVFEYLVSQGLDSKKILTKGYGETKPVADNKTSEGRARNRRTVFVFYQ